MTEKFFVDTNVLVYARDQSEPVKRAAAQKWLESLRQTGNWCVSYQVIHEYYDVIRRKQAKATSPQEARQDIHDLMASGPLAPSPAMLEGAWIMQDKYQLSWWDSLIVGAAKVGGCAYLLSEDFSAGQDYDGVRVINPFATEPSDVLR
jgi:predicted nucleic acid-binding protein